METLRGIIKMKFYTWCNDKTDSRLNRLLKSAKSNNISIETIGEGRDINEGGVFNGKNIWLYEKLKSVNDDEIVVCTDAFDVIYLTNENEIYTKFVELNKPIIYGAERYGACGNTRIYKKMRSLNKLNNLKYLNAGVVIGYAKHLRILMSDIMDDMKKLSWKWSCDQGYIMRRYTQDQSIIGLDYYQEIFWTDIFYDKEYWPPNEESWRRHISNTFPRLEKNYIPKNLINGRLRNDQTNTFPCILHVPTNKYMSSITDLIFNYTYNS